MFFVIVKLFIDIETTPNTQYGLYYINKSVFSQHWIIKINAYIIWHFKILKHDICSLSLFYFFSAFNQKGIWDAIMQAQKEIAYKKLQAI